MRVLWVIKTLRVGGAERLLVAHARLRRRDVFHIECAYVVPGPNSVEQELEEVGVRCSCIGGPAWPLRLRRLLLDGEYDVVHVHSPLVAAVARVVARTVRPRPGLVYTEHNQWDAYRAPTRIVNRLTYGLDDTHVAVSDAVKESVTIETDLDVVIHGPASGWDHAGGVDRRETRAALGVGESEVLVGTVANLRPEKAPLAFLELARLVTQTESSVRFVHIGVGPLASDARQLRDRLGMGDRLQYLGFRSDVAALMAGFDVFVLTSLNEGLPVTLMEAMSVGLPVAATAAGGITDAIEDGVEGFLVPVGDMSRLSEQIVRLARSAPLRERMGQASKAKARAMFDMSAAVREIERRYVQVS